MRASPTDRICNTFHQAQNGQRMGGISDRCGPSEVSLAEAFPQPKPHYRTCTLAQHSRGCSTSNDDLKNIPGTYIAATSTPRPVDTWLLWRNLALVGSNTAAAHGLAHTVHMTCSASRPMNPRTVQPPCSHKRPGQRQAAVSKSKPGVCNACRKAATATCAALSTQALTGQHMHGSFSMLLCTTQAAKGCWHQGAVLSACSGPQMHRADDVMLLLDFKA